MNINCVGVKKDRANMFSITNNLQSTIDPARKAGILSPDDISQAVIVSQYSPRLTAPSDIRPQRRSPSLFNDLLNAPDESLS